MNKKKHILKSIMIKTNKDVLNELERIEKVMHEFDEAMYASVPHVFVLP